MDLSPRKVEKAREAIDFLSSLPGTSGGSTPSTSTDSGDKIKGNHAHLTNCYCLAETRFMQLRKLPTVGIIMMLWGS